MNTELLRKVRAAVADESHVYDQTTYWLSDNGRTPSPNHLCYVSHNGEWCGTPACIAGWAVYEAGIDAARRAFTLGDRYIDEAATYMLGLTYEQQRRMFDPCPVPTTYGAFATPTRAEALAMLDYAIEHDKVVWPLRGRAS